MVFKMKEDLEKMIILKGHLGLALQVYCIKPNFGQSLSVMVGLNVCNMPLKSQDPLPAVKYSYTSSRENTDYQLTNPMLGDGFFKLSRKPGGDLQRGFV